MVDSPVPRLVRVALLALFLPALAAADVIKLCDSHNPPYVLGEESASPATGGLAVEIARKIFDRLPNTELEIDVLPWSRCLEAARNGDYDGVLKLLPNDERAEYLEFTTHPIYKIEMSMFYRPDQFPQGLSWTSLADLREYKLGVVRGSSNGPRVDAAIADGTLRAEEVGAEALNVRKLAAKRIDIFPNDRVMGLADVRAAGFEGEIVPSDQVIDSAEIFIGISKKSPSLGLLPEIDRILGELWEEGEVERILGI